jgi:hypothetical protein
MNPMSVTLLTVVTPGDGDRVKEISLLGWRVEEYLVENGASVAVIRRIFSDLRL